MQVSDISQLSSFLAPVSQMSAEEAENIDRPSDHNSILILTDYAICCLEAINFRKVPKEIIPYLVLLEVGTPSRGLQFI